MCPALILAAKRKDKVIGRTSILNVSIIINAGESHEGAPEGRRLAINWEGELIIEDIINDNHNGNPKIKVKIKWEEVPKMYGVNPIRLIKIKNKNKVEIIIKRPFRLLLFLRFNCSEINLNGEER